MVYIYSILQIKVKDELFRIAENTHNISEMQIDPKPKWS